MFSDSHNKLTDAVAMKTKNNDEILNAFKTIYKRKILKLPLQIEVDSGNEFKGVVSDYFKNNDVIVRVAKPSRHRQQAMVERRNQIIGTALFKRMANQEVLTGEPSKEWKDELPLLIKHMNANTKKTFIPIRKIPEKPVGEGAALKLINIGTKVRVILERPKDILGDNLHGKFRSGDIRWDRKERIIKDVILKSGYPPMYLLDGNSGNLKIEPVAYTKNQLQVIPNNEKLPSPSLIHPKAWRIEKIIDEKKLKGKLYYLVKWRGFPDSDNTWQSKKELTEDVSNFDELLQYYNSNQSGNGLIGNKKILILF